MESETRRTATTPVSPDGARVSLCLIVKNEEKHLADCLSHAVDLVNEVIVVDTGSTDRTKEIAASFGARVFEFPWVDCFATARNESKKHATGEWIFWLDADDRIDEANRQRLRTLFAGLKDELAAYLMRVNVLTSLATEPVRVVDHARLFRNHPDVRWHYRVHEQVLPTILALGGKVHRSDVLVCHVGYQDASQRRVKLERNIGLMQLDMQQKPNDPFVHYNLGRALERLERLPEAIPHWEKSLKNAPRNETYVRKLYALLSAGHYSLGKMAEALRYCLAGLARFPEDPELLFLTASSLFKQEDCVAAESCLVRLLALPPATHMALGDDPAIATHRARHLLARVFHDQKRLDNAETLWRELLAGQPNFTQAWLGLGQTLLEKKAFAELDEVVAKLESLPDGSVCAAVLTSLRLAAEKRFDNAKKLMADAVVRFPTSLEPRILHARLCMRDRHADPAAAERAVRAVLELDPTNREAERQLGKLLGAPSATDTRVTKGAPR